MVQVLVLGGGISGLAAAWKIKRRYGRDVDLKVLEASSRSGGWVRTALKEGFLFEAGPRSCRSQGEGAYTLQLIEQLGLQDAVITPSRDAHKRYIYRHRRLHRVPSGPFSMCTSPLTRSALWPLMKECWLPSKDLEDESIHDFIERRLGRHVAETLVDPMVSGIYAGDTKKLSIQSCFPLLHQWEKEKGSILRGALSRQPKKSFPRSPFIRKIQKQSSLFSLRKGIEQLTTSLEKHLNAEMLFGCAVKCLTVSPSQIEVRCTNGQIFQADHLISTLPAPALSQIVEEQDPVLSQGLARGQQASIAAVGLGYHQPVLKKKGFGYLIPSCESERVLGCVWDSCIFPQHNFSPSQTRLTVMVGGEHMPNFSAYRPKDFEVMAQDALSRHLGVDARPDCVAVHIAKKAIPQYALGHRAWVAEVRERMRQLSSRISILGNHFDGVAVNHCISNADMAVEELSRSFLEINI